MQIGGDARLAGTERRSRGVSFDHGAGPELAIRYPHLARRLMLAAAAYRLAPSGRQLLAEVAPPFEAAV